MSVITRQLREARIPFERFDAIDGNKIDPDEVPYFSRQRYELRHGRSPSPREIGCFMSHIGVMRAFLETGSEYCLVLEDDAIFEPQLARLFDGLRGNASKWDVVLLYGNHVGTPLPLARIDDEHRLIGFFTRQTGAVAYVVNRRAASIYLRELLPMTLPIDIDFDRAWDFSIRFRGVQPFPVRTGKHPSDIGPLGCKFPWHRRWRTYRARTLTEMRRLIHYCLVDPIWLKALWFYLESALQIPSYKPLAGAVMSQRRTGEANSVSPLHG